MALGTDLKKSCITGGLAESMKLKCYMDKTLALEDILDTKLIIRVVLKRILVRPDTTYILVWLVCS